MKDSGDNADGSQGKSQSARCMMYDFIVFENLHFPFSRVSRALCPWDRFQKPAVRPECGLGLWEEVLE